MRESNDHFIVTKVTQINVLSTTTEPCVVIITLIEVEAVEVVSHCTIVEGFLWHRCRNAVGAIMIRVWVRGILQVVAVDDTFTCSTCNTEYWLLGLYCRACC